MPRGRVAADEFGNRDDKGVSDAGAPKPLLSSTPSRGGQQQALLHPPLAIASIMQADHGDTDRKTFNVYLL